MYFSGLAYEQPETVQFYSYHMYVLRYDYLVLLLFKQTLKTIVCIIVVNVFLHKLNIAKIVCIMFVYMLHILYLRALKL